MSKDEDSNKVSLFFERLSQIYTPSVEPDQNCKTICINFLNSLNISHQYNYQYCLGALDRRIEACVRGFNKTQPIHTKQCMPQSNEEPVARTEDADIECQSAATEKQMLYKLAKNIHEYTQLSTESGKLSEDEAREMAHISLLAFVASLQ